MTCPHCGKTIDMSEQRMAELVSYQPPSPEEREAQEARRLASFAKLQELILAAKGKR
jgi:hypothetical protein